MCPFQVIRMRFFVGDRGDGGRLEVFRVRPAAMNASASFARDDDRHTLLAIRRSPARCRPARHISSGTASRLMSRPSASSPIATDTPPAPKSLQRRMSFVDFRLAEQALASFRSIGRVALLHLRAAGFKGLLGVGLGGAGGAAAAVAAGPAAEQDDHVAGVGNLADDVFSRRRADDRADLHPLGYIARVVDLDAPAPVARPIWLP